MILTLSFANIALGASFVVDDTQDTRDINPGDCVCETALRSCTLRAAVMESNACPLADGRYHSVILSPRVYTVDYLGRGEADAGDIDVTSDVHIIGPKGNASIESRMISSKSNASRFERVFDVASGASLSISNVDLYNAPAPLHDFALARPHQGGLIRNAGDLSLENVGLSNGKADAGGAIYTSGTLEMVDCELNTNTAWQGGAIYATSARTTLTRTKMERNRVWLHNGTGCEDDLSDPAHPVICLDSDYDGRPLVGGAVYNDAHSTLDVREGFGPHHWIYGNFAFDGGGAIYNGGALSVQNTDFWTNTATGTQSALGEIGPNGGGDILSDNPVYTELDRAAFAWGESYGNGGSVSHEGPRLVIENCVFWGSYSRGTGTAVYVHGDGSDQANVFAHNTLNYPAGDLAKPLLFADHQQVIAVNNIFDQKHVDLSIFSEGPHSACGGSVVGENNLLRFTDSVCGGDTATITQDAGVNYDFTGGASHYYLNGVSYYGPTEGHYLKMDLSPTSPAVDTGADWACPAQDYLGDSRDSLCDIGAREFSR